jgi:hypothetical protein
MSHEHKFAIVSHTLPGVTGKDRRVLITCQVNWLGAKRKDGSDKTRRCMSLEVLRPHAGKKRDYEFAEKFDTLPHLCCNDDPSTLGGVFNAEPMAA